MTRLALLHCSFHWPHSNVYKSVQINTWALRRSLVSGRPSTTQGTDRRSEDIWLTADQRLVFFLCKKDFSIICFAQSCLLCRVL